MTINDAFLGTYYFWWTNLTYLPAFFFILILACLSPYFNRVNISLWLLGCIIFTIYPTELLDYLVINASDKIHEYSDYGLNILLSNTLNRYHPCVFYISVAALFSSLIHHFRFDFHILAQTASFTRPTHIHTSELFVPVLNFLALWMGSWWALQEGTWGGWWNWDPSEMFGLLGGLLGLAFFHSRKTLLNPLVSLHRTLLAAIVFISTYFFIQLNFDLVSHNFGSKFFFFFNNNLFFLEIISLGSVFGLYVLWNTFISHKNSINWIDTTNKAPQTLYLYPKSSILVLIALWFIWSYKQLLNYFLWNFFELNTLNFSFTLLPINTLLVGFACIWFIRFSISNISLIAVMPFNVSWPSETLLWWLQYTSTVRAYHSLLITFTLLSLITNSFMLTTWNFNCPAHWYVFSTYVELKSYHLFVTDNVTIEFLESWTTLASPLVTSWSTFSSSNTPLINLFSLELLNFQAQNRYQLGGLYTTIFLDLELPLVSSLNLFFLIGFSIWTFKSLLISPPSKLFLS